MLVVSVVSDAQVQQRDDRKRRHRLEHPCEARLHSSSTACGTHERRARRWMRQGLAPAQPARRAFGISATKPHTMVHHAHVLQHLQSTSRLLRCRRPVSDERGAMHRNLCTWQAQQRYSHSRDRTFCCRGKSAALCDHSPLWCARCAHPRRADTGTLRRRRRWRRRRRQRRQLASHPPASVPRRGCDNVTRRQTEFSPATTWTPCQVNVVRRFNDD